MCSNFRLLGVESRDFSHVKKERTVCKDDQIHKMTTIVTQNGPRLSFLTVNNCYFCEFAQFFFLSMRKVT